MLYSVRWEYPPGTPNSRLFWTRNETGAFLCALDENPEIEECLDSVIVGEYVRFGIWDVLEHGHGSTESGEYF